MAKGAAAKNYWTLLLLVLAGIVLGGFIGELTSKMKEAFAAYRKEVADGTFPAPEHTFKMDETILDKLY